MKNDAGNPNIKRNLLRKFRAEKRAVDAELDAHYKEVGGPTRCTSDCRVQADARVKIQLYNSIIREVLNA
jgi:hypothetical protein